jgi:hypothetical protein
MRILDRLDRKFSRFAIPNVTIVLIIGQAVFFILNYIKVLPLDKVTLIGSKVLEGEFWRLITFLFIPIPTDIFFAAFVWYLYYLYGSALESTWGAFKYNVYIILSYILTVSIAFIIPDQVLTNGYLYGTIFLAFAFLYPDFVLYIFFVLPVKIKWLSIIVWIGYAFVLIFGNWINRILLLVSLGNYLLFFAGDIIMLIKYGRRRMAGEIGKIKKSNEPFHKCYTCGITDKDDPKMQFRYCSDCKELTCYCIDHINNHECTK